MHGGERGAGLDHHHVPARVDLAYAAHAFEGQQHLALRDLAGDEAGVAALGRDGHALLGADADQRGDLVHGAGEEQERRLAPPASAPLDQLGGDAVGVLRPAALAGGGLQAVERGGRRGEHGALIAASPSPSEPGRLTCAQSFCGTLPRCPRPPAPFAPPRVASLSLALAGALLAQGVAPAAATAAPLVVKVGEAKAFSRLELHGVSGGVRREGDTLVVRLPRAAAPDMARLHVDPPPYLADATLKPVGGQVELRLTLAKGADAKSGFADGATWINLFPTPAPSKDQPASDRAARPRPRRAAWCGCRRRTRAARCGCASPGARRPARRCSAAARRSGWCSTPRRGIDLSAAPRGLRQAKGFQASAGPGWTALRFASPPDTPVSAERRGRDVDRVAGGRRPPPTPSSWTRPSTAPRTLTAHVAGAIGRVLDPRPDRGRHPGGRHRPAPGQGAGRGVAAWCRPSSWPRCRGWRCGRSRTT